MQQTLTQEKKAGLVGTIVFHLILLLIFLFAGLKYMNPPIETGVLLNFGTSETGSGEIQPTTTEVIEPTPSQPQPSEAVATTSSPEEEVLTQNAEETVEVKPSKEELEKKRKAAEEAKRIAEEQERIKQEQLAEQQRIEAEKKKQEDFLKKLQGANSAMQNNSTSQGVTQGEGDQGKTNGTANGSDYNGPSGNNGKGVATTLSGRSALSAPAPTNNTQEDGTVVVDITVDRNGNVIRAIAGGKGTTATSNVLYKKAEAAALKAKFSQNSTAPAEQFGQIKYVFILE